MRIYGYVKSAMVAAALAFGLVGIPAHAALVVVGPCDTALFAPTATACSGYYKGNLLGGSPSKVADQRAAVDALPDEFQFDGSWASVEATKITRLSGIGNNLIDFGRTLFGTTIIGAHFGNVAGPAGNVTGFWQFDFGTMGTSSVRLTNTQGFSNAVLYTTGTQEVVAAVPEPSTWAMMLIGFAFAGAALRKQKTGVSENAWAARQA